MKKLSLLLLTVLISVMGWAAELDPNTGWNHLNPYAYDLRSEVINDGTTIRLTYKFNAPGLSNSDDYNKLNPKEGAQKTGRGIQIYLLYKNEQGEWQRVQKDDGTGVYTIYSGGYSAAQAYTVDVPVIDIPSNCKGKELTWEAVVHGNVGRTVPKIIKEATKQPQNAYGIAVNNDPMHVRFAQMFVSEAKPYITNTAPYGYTGWDKYGNNADYRYANAMLEYTPLLGFQCAHFKHWHNDVSPAYFASVWDYTYKLTCTYSHNYEPNRIKVSEDGRTFVSSFHPTASCAVLEYGRNRDVYNGHHFYNTIDNVWQNNRDLDEISDKVEGVYDPFLYRRCIGMDVKGKGKDLKIILLWIDANACSYTNKQGTKVRSAKFLIYEYELGKAESDGYIATNRYLPPFDTNCDYVRKIGEYNDWDYQAWDGGGAFFQGAIYGYNGLLYNNMLRGFADLAYGSNDDVWVKIDYCAEAAATPKIVRVKLSNGTTTDYTVAKNTANCGGSGILIKDGLLITSPTNNTICMYEIKSNGELTATNNIPTAKYTITDDKIGAWVTGFATDYAGNLFALTQASTSGEDYTANVLGIAMPYKTAITTRAKSTFTVSDPVPNILATDLRYAPAKSGGKYVFSFFTNTKPEYAEIRFYNSYDNMKQNLAVVNADNFSGDSISSRDTENLVCIYSIPKDKLKQGKIEVELGMVGGELNAQKFITNDSLPRGELYWSVYVQTRESSVFAPIYEQSTTGDDVHQRLHATVNNYPETDGFGHIYAVNYYNDNNPNNGLMVYGFNPNGNSNDEQNNIKNSDRYKLVKNYLNPTGEKPKFTNQRRLDVAPDGKVYIADCGSSQPFSKNAIRPWLFNNGGVYVWNPNTQTGDEIQVSQFLNDKTETSTGVAIYNHDGQLKMYATNTYGEFSNHELDKYYWDDKEYSEENQKDIDVYGWNGFKEYKLGTPENILQQETNGTVLRSLGMGDGNGNISIVAMEKGVWLAQNRLNDVQYTIDQFNSTKKVQALPDNDENYILSFVPYGTNERSWTSCSGKGIEYKYTGSGSNKVYTGYEFKADASELTQLTSSPLQACPGAGLAYRKTNGKEYLYIVNHQGNIVELQITEWVGNKPTVKYIKTYPGSGPKGTNDGGRVDGAINSMCFDYAGNLVTTSGADYLGSASQNVLVYTMPYDRTNAREIQAPNSCRYIPPRVSHLEPRGEIELTIQPFIDATKQCYVDIFRPMPNTSFSTICLPFDLDMTRLTTEKYTGAEVLEFTGVSVNTIGGEKILELQFSNISENQNYPNIIKANVPYIIKPEVRIPGIVQIQKLIQFETMGEQSLTNTFDDNIDDDNGTPNNSITYTGVIPTSQIDVRDGHTLILVAENRLAWMLPDAGQTTGTINGLRGYFTLEHALPQGMQTIISKKDKTVTGLIDANGQRVNIQKYLREGRVYIRMGDTLYTIDGQKVK